MPWYFVSKSLKEVLYLSRRSIVDLVTITHYDHPVKIIEYFRAGLVYRA